MPNFSVILPTYNRAPLVGRAIDSVLEQTHPDFELIVVDDGSTDGTMDILDEFADRDSRVRVIEQTNAGPAGARNTGLGLAMGRLITYLDSDNTLHPDNLEVVDAELREPFIAAYTGQNLLLVGGTLDEPVIEGRKTRSTPYNPDELLRRANFIDINCFSHLAALRETVGLFDPTDPWDDWGLIARIATEYPFGIKHIDQVLGTYNVYQPEVIPTVSNQHPGWSAGIRQYFGVEPVPGPNRDMIHSIAALMRVRYPYPFPAEPLAGS